MQPHQYRTLKKLFQDRLPFSGDDTRKRYEKRNMVSPWCFEATQHSFTLDVSEKPPLLFDVVHQTKLRVIQGIDCKAAKLGCSSSHFQRLLLLS